MIGISSKEPDGWDKATQTEKGGILIMYPAFHSTLGNVITLTIYHSARFAASFRDHRSLVSTFAVITVVSLVLSQLDMPMGEGTRVQRI